MSWLSVPLRHVQWRGDLVAGLTLAAIAIPEQMATARLAGFPPHVGFAAFIAGALAFALSGSSRVVSVGADSTIAPIFAGALGMIAASGSPHYHALASLLALLVGGPLTIAWLLRAGSIADLDVAAIPEIVEATTCQQQAIHEASAGALKKNPGSLSSARRSRGAGAFIRLRRKRSKSSVGASLRLSANLV